MKEPATTPLAIPPDVAAKCTGPNQFENFDRLVRGVLAIPKAQAAKVHRKAHPPKKSR